MSTVAATGHTFAVDDPIFFANLVGGTGIVEGQLYYILTAPTDEFTFSEDVGGVEVDFTTAIESGSVNAWATYVAITDPTDAQAPPTMPDTPSAPVVDSAVISGIVRLVVVL